MIGRPPEAGRLRCERFTKQEMRVGKTPDFKVYGREKFALYSHRPLPLVRRLQDRQVFSTSIESLLDELHVSEDHCGSP